MERKLITIMHACEKAHVSRRTIYNWLSAGRLETVRTAGGSVRIYEDSLFRPDGMRPVVRTVEQPSVLA